MDLNVWDKCNNRCLMCTNPDWPWPAWDGSCDYSYPAIIRRLEKAKEEIKLDDSIYLTGGEPTLHPRFLDILEYVSRHFPEQRVKLLTNGRKFFYKDFAQKVLATNNNFDICVSIYGPNIKIHDAITRSGGSFEQTTKGLENLLAYKKGGHIFDIRFVISQLSYKHINQFLKMVKQRFPLIDRVILIFWEAEAQAVKNLEAVKVDYSQVRPYLEKSYPLLKGIKEIRFYHFPLCTLSEKFWPYLWRTLPDKEVDFVKACQECNYKKHCLGIHKGYLEYIGAKEFTPVKKHLEVEKTGDTYRPIGRVGRVGR